ncbi:MAG: hypothetical protein KGZ39_00280 [Simkania sp.]|nr:hypothetical protein [Simkania sp.]
MDNKAIQENMFERFEEMFENDDEMKFLIVDKIFDRSTSLKCPRATWEELCDAFDKLWEWDAEHLHADMKGAVRAFAE